jgi:hypothetical protein
MIYHIWALARIEPSIACCLVILCGVFFWIPSRGLLASLIPFIKPPGTCVLGVRGAGERGKTWKLSGLRVDHNFPENRPLQSFLPATYYSGGQKPRTRN